MRSFKGFFFDDLPHNGMVNPLLVAPDAAAMQLVPEGLYPGDGRSLLRYTLLSLGLLMDITVQSPLLSLVNVYGGFSVSADVGDKLIRRADEGYAQDYLTAMGRAEQAGNAEAADQIGVAAEGVAPGSPMVALERGLLYLKRKDLTQAAAFLRLAAERFESLGLVYRDVRLAGGGVAYWLALQCETDPAERRRLALGAIARFHLFGNRLQGEKLASGEIVARFVKDLGQGFRLDYRSIAANQLLTGLTTMEAGDLVGMNSAFDEAVGALQHFPAPFPDWIAACLQLQAALNRTYGNRIKAERLEAEAADYQSLAVKMGNVGSFAVKAGANG